MNALGHHLILHLEDDRVIAPSREARRRWARQLGQLCEELPILVWRLADTHHGVATDPLHDASALPDILGLRRLCPGLPARVREHLPRMPRDALLRHLGVAALEEELHPALLAESAAAAFAIDALVLDGSSARARRAAAAAARDLGVRQVAQLLGVSRACVYQAHKEEPSAADVRAVRLQMSLRMKQVPVTR